MAKKQLQERLKALLLERDAIQKKDELSPDNIARLRQILDEGKSVKGQLDLLKETDDWADAVGQSEGMINLGGKASAKVAFGEQDGTVEITQKGDQLFVNDDGQMMIDDRKWKAITSNEYKRAFKSFLRGGEQRMSYDAIKVLQEGADEQGGYLVPDDILARLIAREPTPTNVAGRVTRVTTSRDALAVPKVRYTTDNLYSTGMRVTWTGEVPLSSTTHRVTEPVFGQSRIPVYTAMMSLPLTNDMVEDANYPLVNWCTSKFAETIDLLYDNMVINGSGANQPHGILVAPNTTDNPATVNSGAATALTADGIIDLSFALPPQYDSNAVFVLNKTNAALAIAKLKDGQGRYLWGQGLQDSGLVPNMRERQLVGYPVLLNEFMPNIAAGTYPIIFGDLRGYWLVTRVGFSIQVLRERYAEDNQIVLLGRLRFGGRVVEDWRLKVQAVSA